MNGNGIGGSATPGSASAVCEVLPLPPLPPITLSPAPSSSNNNNSRILARVGSSASFGSLSDAILAAAHAAAGAVASAAPPPLPVLPRPPLPPPPPAPAPAPAPAPPVSARGSDDTAVCDLYGEWLFERTGGGAEAGKASAVPLALGGGGTPADHNTLDLLIGGTLPAPVPLDLPPRGRRNSRNGRRQPSPPPVDSPALRHMSPAEGEDDEETGGGGGSNSGGGKRTAGVAVPRKRQLRQLQQEDANATPVPSTPPKRKQMQAPKQQRCDGRGSGSGSDDGASVKEGQAETVPEAPTAAAAETAALETFALPIPASASSTDFEGASCRRGPARAARGRPLKSRCAE